MIKKPSTFSRPLLGINAMYTYKTSVLKKRQTNYGLKFLNDLLQEYSL